MEFVLHIATEKKQMRHPRNIAGALERLARDLFERFDVNADIERAEGTVRDVNGSIVGRWELGP